MLSFFGRQTFAKATAPLGKALVGTGLTPDAMTLIGTTATIAAAVTLFPTGHLFWGTMVIWLFVMFDMLDGAMARARGGGTKYGAVLDATCDRVADGAIFGGLAWWAVYHEQSKELFAATLVVLVTSQVISYAKARAEASGLSADGGLIERPDRLVIVLVGAEIEHLAHQRFRCRPHQPPARGVTQIAHPLGEAHDAAPPAASGCGVGGMTVRAPGELRTASTRWKTVTTLATTRIHMAT